MSENNIREAIADMAKTINCQLEFIETRPNGVKLKISKPTKHGYFHDVKVMVKDEKDIGNLKELFGLN
jgi:hypothetical protein